MKKLSFKNIVFRLFALGFAVIFAVFMAKSNSDITNNLKQIYGSFLGQKSSYNGMIEIWNIDTFESGIKSKMSYIDSQAKKFQNKNKGVYVMVRNMTIGECENSLKNGDTPDIISCSYGVSEKLKDYFVSYENVNNEIYHNFLEAGKCDDGKLYGLAWCTGFYALISTKTKLEKANVSFDGVKLNEIAYESSYKYKIGKKEKFSKSIVYGVGDYLMPKNALDAYNRARSIQISQNEKEELALKSQYSAYTSFLSNDATILLGTHRDIFRMSGREEKGKVSDVVYLPLLEWTDLVQFSFLCKNADLKRKTIAESFANFLTLKENQKELEEIGVLPILRVENFENKGVMSHITLENISDSAVKRVF